MNINKGKNENYIVECKSTYNNSEKRTTRGYKEIKCGYFGMKEIKLVRVCGDLNVAHR